MEMAEIFQLMGGFILTFAALPQITQVIITKNVTGINLTTFTMLLIGNFLKIIYGYNMAINGITNVLIITNSMAFLIILILVVLVINYKYLEKGGNSECSQQ
jgi:uncharacterized protein with PQ loop repeat